MANTTKTAAFSGLHVEWNVREEPLDMPVQHFHRHFELYLLLAGQRRYFINDRTYHVERGALVFIPPNQIHKTAEAEGASHERILFEIDPAALSRAAACLPGLALDSLTGLHSLVLQLSGEELAHLRAMAEELFREAAARQAGYQELAVLRLAELLLFLERRRRSTAARIDAEMSERHRKMYEIAGYIQAACGEIRSLEELAGRFYISKFHLCRSFRQVTGLTVQEFITAARVNQAQQQLAEGDASITEIAQIAGYGSLTYFERVFKRAVGIPPGQYRARTRQTGFLRRDVPGDAPTVAPEAGAEYNGSTDKQRGR